VVESPSLEVFQRQVDVAFSDIGLVGLGSVRFMAGLYDLKGLFQLKSFYDSTIWKSALLFGVTRKSGS